MVHMAERIAVKKADPPVPAAGVNASGDRAGTATAREEREAPSRTALRQPGSSQPLGNTKNSARIMYNILLQNC